MLFVGIDPGLTGAIGAVDVGGMYVKVQDTPSMLRLRDEGAGEPVQVRLPDCVGMSFLILRLMEEAGGATELRVTIEEQWARPRQSAQSTFITGGGFWAWLGVLAACGVAVMEVSPQAWKREYGLLGKGKEGSRGRASAYFPAAPLSLKKHHNRADALLLAHYGWQTWGWGT